MLNVKLCTEPLDFVYLTRLLASKLVALLQGYKYVTRHPTYTSSHTNIVNVDIYKFTVTLILSLA